MDEHVDDSEASEGEASPLLLSQGRDRRPDRRCESCSQNVSYAAWSKHVKTVKHRRGSESAELHVEPDVEVSPRCSSPLERTSVSNIRSRRGSSSSTNASRSGGGRHPHIFDDGSTTSSRRRPSPTSRSRDRHLDIDEPVVVPSCASRRTSAVSSIPSCSTPQFPQTENGSRIFGASTRRGDGGRPLHPSRPEPTDAELFGASETFQLPSEQELRLIRACVQSVASIGAGSFVELFLAARQLCPEIPRHAAMGIALTAEWYIPLLRKMSAGTFRLVGNQYSAESYDHRSSGAFESRPFDDGNSSVHWLPSLDSRNSQGLNNGVGSEMEVVTGVDRDAFVAPGHLSERPTGRAHDIPVVAAKSGTAHDADLLLSDRQGTENQGSTSDVRVVAMLVEPALSNISFDVSDTLSDVLYTVNKDMEPRNTELGFAVPEVASSVTEPAPPIVTDGTGSVSHVAKSGLPSAVDVAEPSSSNEEPVTQSSAVEMNTSPVKSLRQPATREATDVGDQANNAEPLNAAGTASPLRTIVTSTLVEIDATEALLDVGVSTGSSKTLVLRLPRVSVPVTDRVSETSNRYHPSPKTLSEVPSTVTANRSAQSASKLSNPTPTMPASRLLSSKQKSKSSTTVATDHHLSLEPKSSHASAVVSVGRHSSSKSKPDRKSDAITNMPASAKPVTLSTNVRNLSATHVQRKTSKEPSRQPTSASSHRDPSGEVQSASSGSSGSSRATISSHGPPPLKKIRSAAKSWRWQNRVKSRSRIKPEWIRPYH
jgi:hypothetical protein